MVLGKVNKLRNWVAGKTWFSPQVCKDGKTSLWRKSSALSVGAKAKPLESLLTYEAAKREFKDRDILDPLVLPSAVTHLC